MVRVTLPDGSRYNIHSKDDWYYILNNFYGKAGFEQFTQQIDALRQQDNNIGKIFSQWQYEVAAYENAKSGNAADALAGYGQSGMAPSASTEKAIDDILSQQNTQQAQNYEQSMRDTNVLSTGKQLEGLGLSSSTIASTGITSSNGVGAAGISHQSAAQTAQQRKLALYQQRMSLTKSLIGAAGQMASSGIYGAALGAMKHSASLAGSATAHSALKALQGMRPEVINQLMKDEAARNTKNSVYGGSYTLDL